MNCIQRKAYYRADGTYVRAHLCQRKQVPIGTLREGNLSQYGYHLANTAAQRRYSLLFAIEAFGATSVFRKLDALSNLQKNRSLLNSKKARGDANWVLTNFL